VNSLIERDELIPISTWNSSDGSIFNLQYIFTGVERDTDFFTNFNEMTFSKKNNNNKTSLLLLLHLRISS
jgi:hypothetical protein